MIRIPAVVMTPGIFIFLVGYSEYNTWMIVWPTACRVALSI